MREILFRGKRVDNGEWVEGDLYHILCSKIEYLIAPIDELGVDVIPKTISQYTGLTDKNGTRIFEGDIVLMPSYQGGKHRAVVYFKNGKFAVNGSNYHFKDIKPRNIEVIGNIFDNHELL